jgi:SM-20-related protein
MAAVPHVILDDFLPEDLHSGILAHVLAVEDFAPGRVITQGQSDYRPDLRKGHLSNDRLGAHLPGFLAALRATFGAICPAVGMAPFDLAEIEIRLAAHTDGDFFSPHRDTMTGSNRNIQGHDRMITGVYYFHRQPKAFAFGELLIHPFGTEPPLVVEPRNNRLVAFPSMLVHEVTPVAVPDGEFANSRFSVSCWFDRYRPGQV